MEVLELFISTSHADLEQSYPMGNREAWAWNCIWGKTPKTEDWGLARPIGLFVSMFRAGEQQASRRIIASRTPPSPAHSQDHALALQPCHPTMTFGMTIGIACAEWEMG